MQLKTVIQPTAGAKWNLNMYFSSKHLTHINFHVQEKKTQPKQKQKKPSFAAK